MNVGMALVLQVGEVNEMPTPPKNFPKCNSYTSEVEDNFDEVPSSALELKTFSMLWILIVKIIL